MANNKSDSPSRKSSNEICLKLCEMLSTEVFIGGSVIVVQS